MDKYYITCNEWSYSLFVSVNNRETAIKIAKAVEGVVFLISKWHPSENVVIYGWND